MSISASQGFEVSASGSFDIGFAEAEASASVSGKASMSDDTEKEVVKEISSAAESNQELVYEIEC